MDRRFFLSKILKGTTIFTLFPGVFNDNSMGKTSLADHPVVISSANGETAVSTAMNLLVQGSDPLDAVIAGVNKVEDDPEELTVGLGGLPNEAGIVQLDASVMHGPTHNAGAVAALEGIRNPSKVAKLVMERSDHVLLVGEGAQDFAKAHGFTVEDLLTEKSRKIWLYWKETLNNNDDWLPPENEKLDEELRKFFNVHGTITCCALDANNDLAGVTTTSGLSFKMPGRVGDSPIPGAGLYVDNAVGAVGSTGRGEANLKNLSCYQAVEFMRQGLHPGEACIKVCQRIVEHTHLPSLKNKKGQPNFNVKFYALKKNGEYGGASIYEGGEFWVTDREGQRKEKMAYLYRR
ncbi:MAG: N(4)-(beta-N-acetylglucosaminyl)-L-asparaginase [Calditrichaeota bacterium]|nr:N(4)-(beta-N-acetylglucosaminyl)-L-asparaginase [Calditrichota bacterium]